MEYTPPPLFNRGPTPLVRLLICSLLSIGLLVADGRLRLDESVPVPEWQRSGDPRGEITLRQLLQMRSGLRHTEAGDPIYESDEVRWVALSDIEDYDLHPGLRNSWPHVLPLLTATLP